MNFERVLFGEVIGMALKWAVPVAAGPVVVVAALVARERAGKMMKRERMRERDG